MTTQKAIDAVYRPSRARDWKDCEIVGQHKDGGLVLREAGTKFWRGVWLAERDQVRLRGAETKG